MLLENILLSENVLESINDNIQNLIKIIPEIEYMFGFDQKNPHHHLDVWNHTLLALSLSEYDFDVRLCLLLHDIGKPFSYQDGDVRHFRNHPKVSAEMSKKILNRLGYDSSYVEYICYLIRYHDSPISKSQIEDNYELCLKLYKIQYCDALAHHPDMLEKRKKYLDVIHKRLLLKR